MSNLTVLDLETNLPLSDFDDIKPTGLVMIIKAKDRHGNTVHTMCSTDEISSVEALGMLNFGKLYAESLSMSQIVTTESSA